MALDLPTYVLTNWPFGLKGEILSQLRMGNVCKTHAHTPCSHAKNFLLEPFPQAQIGLRILPNTVLQLVIINHLSELAHEYNPNDPSHFSLTHIVFYFTFNPS